MKRRPLPAAQHSAEQEARRLYRLGDYAAYGSDERAELYRLAAAAQRQAEAVEALERVTASKRRKAA